MSAGDILGIVGFLTIIALAFVFVYLFRIRYLLNHEGSIQVSVRGTDGRWHNNIAILGPESLDLYPTHSFSWIPVMQWDRLDMSFEIQRPRGGIRVVTIIVADGSWRLAAGSDEMSALLSWMDSARPSAEPTMA